MWIIEYISPYSGKTMRRKFKAKYRYSAESAALDYARETFMNFYQSIEVKGYEIWHGKETGNSIHMNKKYNNYDV